TYTEMVPGSSGVAPIWVEADGTNRIIVIPGANHRLTAPDAEAAIRSMAPPDVVVGQFEIPQDVTTAAFAAGRELGATTILNPAPAEPIAPDLLDHTDWLIPNESEFELLTGEPVSPDAAVRFAERTRTRLVITVGERGALVVTGEVTSVPAVECEPVDTTGAGDAFVGAFAFGVASGLGALDAVGLAVACASASVTRLGTQTSFPTPAECDDIKRSLGW
ncbi:MAG: ribokinase, partial [Acidimicrobiia bacterium]|nr:ribokinase [Acidimicrobiia bacterium]